MSRLIVASCLLALCFQVHSQIIRSPLSYLGPSPYTDTIIELPRNVIDVSRNYIDLPRNYIDVPRNYIETPIIFETPRNLMPQPIIAEQPIIPITNIPTPSTTVITDCTPSVCKNLADTINLMTVSNLLQNTLPDLKTLKMAAPLLRTIMSNPAFSGCPGLISNLVNPNLIAPNFIPPNVVAPNFIPPKVVAPNVVAPNAVAPNRLVAPIPIAPNSNPVAPNTPISNSAMLSSLLKMLGNPV